MQLGLAYAERGGAHEGSLALALTGDAVAYFRRCQYVLYLISALRAHGRVLIALDRPADGLGFLHEALELGNTVSYPWAELSTLCALAVAGRKLGRNDQAAGDFARAVRLAHELGAPRWVPVMENVMSRQCQLQSPADIHFAL